MTMERMTDDAFEHHLADMERAGPRHEAFAERVRELQRAASERDQYHDALIARHGGEPIALLRELDEARAELARWRDPEGDERERRTIEFLQRFAENGRCAASCDCNDCTASALLAEWKSSCVRTAVRRVIERVADEEHAKYAESARNDHD